MSEYYFQNEEFYIENYDKKKTFSSFLPGVAGKKGIPLWAFYVNRGQGIASFGVENKNGQILEFSPAVMSYQNVTTDGFRTFVKMDGNVIEIFGTDKINGKRTMKIQRSEFSVLEVNHDLGLQFEVTYFGLPNENVAALVRKVEITNLQGKPVEFELLDGLSQLLPYQVENSAFKAISNLLRSWMEVYNLEDNIGYYRMRSSSSDSAEVKDIVKGNFYISTFKDELIKPIVDFSLVFGYDTSKRVARHFEEHSLEEIQNSHQVTANKIPVGFTGLNMKFDKNESHTIYTVIGHAHSDQQVLQMKDYIASASYLEEKRIEAQQEISELISDIEMKSAFPIFDDYVKQNMLDNILRGGYPLVLEGKNEDHVYHLFSRRHGDLERDYNFFTLAPEFYSQGNGNFRDVCQNRRNDVYFVPEVKDFNVKMFASFIQIDGYNPLAIEGSNFEIKDKQVVEELNNKLFNGSEAMKNVLIYRFTPGSIINTIANENVETSYTDEEILETIFKEATQHYLAAFGEGYWIDHLTYILDLVESYQGVYPDKLYDILFNDVTYKFYDSPVYVYPRNEKHCLLKDGRVRRFGALNHHDQEKIDRLGMNVYRSNWFKDETGKEVHSNLYGKLFTLAVNKVASLDPSGMGIEMEANKPGWNDAMNGLPGLFGSGISETIELKRVLTFLLDQYSSTEHLELPLELVEFTENLSYVLKTYIDDFKYWDHANNVKELFRDKVRFGTKGLTEVQPELVKEFLEQATAKIDVALNKALRLGNGIYPTYLVHEVVDFEPIMENGNPKIGTYGLPTVTVKEFKVRALPYYLEAPARALKIMKNTQQKKTMYNNVKMSNVYDHQLKFYKTSEFLDDESNEIGRGRSFTKGWLERESNFLHMTYKYLLGLLKGGLYDEFFEEIKTNLTCFMDPEVYGRSTLENSSFIASSVNPDPSVRGQGWVARLSGSTAEMLSIWTYMMFGGKPFEYRNNKLVLDFKPKLSKEFFVDGRLSFKFLGKTNVTYINESNINTYDAAFKVKKYVIEGVEYPSVEGELAEQLRSGSFAQVDVYF